MPFKNLLKDKKPNPRYKPFSFKLPEELLKEFQAKLKQDHLQASEVLREGIKMYLDEEIKPKKKN